jgi:hypothetical protein
MYLSWKESLRKIQTGIGQNKLNMPKCYKQPPEGFTSGTGKGKKGQEKI